MWRQLNWLYTVLIVCNVNVLVLGVNNVNKQTDNCNDYIARRTSLYGKEIESQVNYFRNLTAQVIGKTAKSVTFTCGHGSLLRGNAHVTCFDNGTWSADIPECIEQCPALSDTNTLKLSTRNRTINTIVNVNCSSSYNLIGPRDLKCNHGSYWSEGFKRLDTADLPFCKEKPPYTDWKLYLIISGSGAGFIIFVVIFFAVCIWTRRKQGKYIDDIVRSDPNAIRSMFCVKVWSSDRQRKKLLFADSWQSLKNTACLEFNLNGRLVLEKDGSPITDEHMFNRNKEKTLMILGRNEEWRRPRSRMYNDSNPGGAFQVFSYDRKKSVMVLCYSLEDLCEQAQHMLGYKPQQVCFEEDGTMITSDRELFAFTGSRLMVLKTGSTWSDQYNRRGQTYMDIPGRHRFTVWTEDGRKRKEVSADSIVGLHFAAANALDLQPPLEITTLHGQPVNDESLLQTLVHDVLVATEVRHNRKFNLNSSREGMSVYSA